jgi:hypothetical protein
MVVEGRKGRVDGVPGVVVEEPRPLAFRSVTVPKDSLRLLVSRVLEASHSLFEPLPDDVPDVHAASNVRADRRSRRNIILYIKRLFNVKIIKKVVLLLTLI